MVLINFWATWCGPCKSEFPAMNAAYEQMKDDVAVIAITTEPTDSLNKVKDFKSTNGIMFDMASYSTAGEEFAGCFDTSGIPVSIMVDRYGVITYYHMGSMQAATDFTSRFDKFLGENYNPTIIIGSGDSENGGSGDEDATNQIKPTVAAPSLNDIKQSFAQGSNDFTFAWDNEDDLITDLIAQDTAERLKGEEGAS